MKVNTTTGTENGKTTIRFYDADYAGHSGFDPQGQFIASYYVETLMTDRDRLESCGLDLCGYEPKWKLTGNQMTDIFKTLVHG